MERKVDSDDLKTLGLCWLRFKKQFDLICTEDPARSADILGTDSSIQCRKMIEIETKVSIADLRADQNKTSGYSYIILKKHERLAKALAGERMPVDTSRGFHDSPADKDAIHGVELSDTDHSRLPSQFYFLVPVDIKDKALEVINELYPHAGLMVGMPRSSSYFDGSQIAVIKRAPVLHRLLIAKAIKGQMSARMASEICKLRLDVLREKWSNKKKEVPDVEPKSDPPTSS